MKRRHLIVGLAAAGALAACKDGAPGASAAPAAAGSTPVSMEAIAAEATGFNVGSAMSARTVYVFFDAQCPHCATLWETARPLRAQARFVWIPVGVLNATSTAQGASLLAAGDPVKAMDEHEASMREKRGGIGAGGTDAQKEAVKKNTNLLTKFGLGSVPTIIAKNAKTGEIVTIEGALPTAGLAERLGLNVPAS
jgi:thiol:disulfide interchange protein DsbG